MGTKRSERYWFKQAPKDDAVFKYATKTMSILKKLFGDKALPKADIAEGESARPSTASNLQPPSIHNATREGDLEKVRSLLKADPNLVFSHSRSQDRFLFGLTPLHLAAFMGLKAMVELLLANKAEVNAQASDGSVSNYGSIHQHVCGIFTPLHLAAGRGHKEVVELLLAKKADVHVIDKNGATPLFLAAFAGHEGVVELLLANKANVKAVSTIYAMVEMAGLTPLHAAAFAGHRGVAELLLANKAEINARDISHNTPLHYAAWFDHKEVVELLIANKAEVNAKSIEGTTSTNLAVYHCRNNIAEFLRQHGGHE
jgi:ankyrin repeat protein